MGQHGRRIKKSNSFYNISLKELRKFSTWPIVKLKDNLLSYILLSSPLMEYVVLLRGFFGGKFIAAK